MDLKLRSLRWLFCFDIALFLSAALCGLVGRTVPAYSIGGAGLVLLAWQVVLIRRNWGRAEAFPMEWHIKNQHYLQAIVQACHYAYWACYWDQVLVWVPLIATQVLFAYILDAMLSWLRGKKWLLGFGPLPIVGSVNLFLWFREDYFYWQLVLIATTFFVKEFVTWNRNGKRTHIFNPSAIGLSLAGVSLMVTRSVDCSQGVDLINSFYLPANFYELMFLFGMLLQFLFATTLVTWGAVISQCAIYFGSKLLLGAPITAGPVDIAVFLGFNLLVTDPSTSPRSKAGKFMFGLAYGFGVFLAYAILRYASQPSYLDKILVVPIMNLLASKFDRWSEFWFQAWTTRRPKLAARLGNHYLHMTLYALMFLAVLTPLKHADPSVSDPLPPHAFHPSPEMRQLQARAIAFRIVYPDAYAKFGFLWEFLYFDDYRYVLQQDTVAAHIRLGDALLHPPLELYDYALEHLQRALELDPQDEDAIRAMQYAREKQQAAEINAGSDPPGF